MTITELLLLANKGYEDGICSLKGYFTAGGRFNLRGRGDGLARFIVVELIETHDREATEEQQKREAVRVLRSAVRQLESVIASIEA